MALPQSSDAGFLMEYDFTDEGVNADLFAPLLEMSVNSCQSFFEDLDPKLQELLIGALKAVVKIRTPERVDRFDWYFDLNTFDEKPEDAENLPIILEEFYNRPYFRIRSSLQQQPFSFGVPRVITGLVEGSFNHPERVSFEGLELDKEGRLTTERVSDRLCIRENVYIIDGRKIDPSLSGLDILASRINNDYDLMFFRKVVE